MSNLEEDAIDYALDDMDNNERFNRINNADADFAYWVTMPFWTLSESVALFLGKDPKILTGHNIRTYKYCFSPDLREKYARLRTLFSRALERRELEESNSPATLLAWAEIRNIKVPEAFESHMHQPRPTVFDNRSADFVYWSKMPFWTLDESIALLLNKNPAVVTWDKILMCQEHGYASDLCRDYTSLKTLLLRALEAQELKESNIPVTFLSWAKTKDLKIPEALQQAVDQQSPSPRTEDLQAQEIEALKAQITGLENRMTELKDLESSIFDESRPTYAPELAIAVKAHQTLSKSWQEGSSVKNQIVVWVKQIYSALSESATERIAMVSNWDKSGGSPITPSRSESL